MSETTLTDLAAQTEQGRLRRLSPSEQCGGLADQVTQGESQPVRRTTPGKGVKPTEPEADKPALAEDRAAAVAPPPLSPRLSANESAASQTATSPAPIIDPAGGSAAPCVKAAATA